MAYNPYQQLQQLQNHMNNNQGGGTWQGGSQQGFQSLGGKRASEDILARLNPVLRERIQWMKDYLPMQKGMLSRGLSMLNNSSRQGDINKFNRSAVESFMGNAGSTAQMLRSQGVTDAGTAGLFTDAMNQANMATGDFAAEAYSPEAQLQNLLKSLGLINDVTGEGFDLWQMVMGSIPPPAPPSDPLGGFGGIAGALIGLIPH